MALSLVEAETQIYVINECDEYMCQLPNFNSKHIKNHKQCNGKCSEISNDLERIDGI